MHKFLARYLLGWIGVEYAAQNWEVEIKGGICYHLATLELLVPIDTSY